MNILLQTTAMPRPPSQPAVGTRSSSQVCPKPHVTRGCPNAGWDPAAQVPVVHGQPLPCLKSNPPACQPSKDLSTSACATSLVCHLSVDHLAAWVAQQEDSSERVTLAWPMQKPQTLPQDTTGSLWATSGSHSQLHFQNCCLP